MKKIITLLAVCFLGVANIKAQKIYISEPAIKNCITTEIDYEISEINITKAVFSLPPFSRVFFSGDTLLVDSLSGIYTDFENAYKFNHSVSQVPPINIGLSNKGIKNMQGLQYIERSLETVDLSNNLIDNSGYIKLNGIVNATPYTVFNFKNNKLTGDVGTYLNGDVTYLDSNLFTSANINMWQMHFISARYNQITKASFSGEISAVDLSYNLINNLSFTAVETSPYTTSLNLSYNNLARFPVIDYYQFGSSSTPFSIDLSYNKIDSLGTNKITGSSSFQLDINLSNNKLSQIKSNALLQCVGSYQIPLYINIDNNNISNAISLYNGVVSYSCKNNNLYCLSQLPASLLSLTFDTAKIKCLPNKPSGISGIATPICNASYNPYNCQLNGTSNLINYVNIPDTSFGKFLLAQYPSCLYKDASNLYWMDTTCSGVVSTTKINWAANFFIKNIEGIQYFKNLDSLSITKFSQLDSIHQLPANLKYLKTVSCLALKVFDSLPVTVTSFNCDTNNLSKLPILPTGLQYLSCRFNFLHNTITSLPAALTYFDCSDNVTTTLPSSLPNSLQTLIVARNAGLQCLPQLPNTLTQLNVANTQVACLPNMPNNLVTSLSVCNGSNNPNGCAILPNTYVNIPDKYFGSFLRTKFFSCIFQDAAQKFWMDTTCSGVVNQKALSIDASNIMIDITGIQYFKSLTYLSIIDNWIDSIGKLPQSITWLKLYNNNKLRVISMLPDSLVNLDLRMNYNLENLPAIPNNVKYLVCYFSKLSSLQNLPDSLINLNCSSNYLSILPSLPNLVQNIYCGGNYLSILPSLPNLVQNIDCGGNYLSSLPTLPNSVQSIKCWGNNIYCLPKLPASLKEIHIDTSKIKCLPNFVAGLQTKVDYSGNFLIYPICNPTNNINQCQAFPTIAGRVFTDNNSNGIKDANEFYRPFVKELASNGDATFSNLNGEFAFSFDSIGNYSLKTIAPAYFKAVPDSNSFSFNTNNVYLSVPDIALQPTAVKDSLAIVVTPLNSRARPGFGFPYHLGYANVGTTNLYTTVSFTYDTSRLVYDSSSVAIISNTNNTIVVSADSLIAGQGKYAQLYFTVKPTAVIGDTLFAVANAVSIATTATNGNTTIIRGSFDPNDKVATPQLTPTQIANGDKVEYTIHFQNTGNDTAINVVLADTLSILLQPGYFDIISTSHPSNITYHIDNNIVYFEFLNINLPDSATNYSGSQGWITFKVKPLIGITDGTYINNKASIYFDYNKPVLTNLAKTLISSTPMPIKLLSYELKLVNEATRNEKRVTNIWATTNEINASHFNIQRSIDGVNFKTIGQVKAVGASRYSFIDNSLSSIDKQKTTFYRLLMVDNDGRFEYSPIREINLQPSISNIRLYPNPAKELVTIECVNAKEILITDYFGRIKYKAITNNQLSIINVQGFAKGVYLVQVVLDNGSIKTEKLIIE